MELKTSIKLFKTQKNKFVVYIIYQYCFKFSVKLESRERSFYFKVNAFETVFCQYSVSRIEYINMIKMEEHSTKFAK